MKNNFILLLTMGLFVACGKSPSNQISETLADTSTGTEDAGEEVQLPPSPPTPAQVDEYLQLVNDHRKKLGLRPVENSEVIQDVSLEHSSRMAQRRRFFGHGGWKQRCREIRERLQGNLCGEIVAVGQETPEDVFNAWLNSPPHRQVIEGPSYTHTGLGYIANKRGQIYWTQLFLEISM